MDYKISIIVPVYNVEKYLTKCINSITNQTYRNLEIILINDGSTDKSREICETHASKDERITVINKVNGGLSDARNTGIEAATGNYMCFIDSDDYIHELFCEVLLKLTIENDSDIAMCDFLKVYEKGNCIKRENYKHEKVSLLNNIEALNSLFTEDYIATVVVWNKLYKRELFTDIRFPKGKIHEDDFTTFKVLYKSNKLVRTSKSLHYYLQRSNSIMGREFNSKHFDALDAYSHQIDFYEKNKLFDLKNKAVRRLEGLLRKYMNCVLTSDMENKNASFSYLRKYYIDNLKLFKENLSVGVMRKALTCSYIYGPKALVKLVSKLIDLRQYVLGKIKPN